jgi:hypothetical protein
VRKLTTFGSKTKLNQKPALLIRGNIAQKCFVRRMHAQNQLKKEAE